MWFAPILVVLAAGRVPRVVEQRNGTALGADGRLYPSLRDYFAHTPMRVWRDVRDEAPAEATVASRRATASHRSRPTRPTLGVRRLLRGRRDTTYASFGSPECRFADYQYGNASAQHAPAPDRAAYEIPIAFVNFHCSTQCTPSLGYVTDECFQGSVDRWNARFGTPFGLRLVLERIVRRDSYEEFVASENPPCPDDVPPGTSEGACPFYYFAGLREELGSSRLTVFVGSGDGASNVLGYAYLPYATLQPIMWMNYVFMGASDDDVCAHAPLLLDYTFAHELGHIFGLEHVFVAGKVADDCTEDCAYGERVQCATGGAHDAWWGDKVADTYPRYGPTFTCAPTTVCGVPNVASRNIMDYLPELDCPLNFTSGQARRMRCTVDSIFVADGLATAVVPTSRDDARAEYCNATCKASGAAAPAYGGGTTCGALRDAYHDAGCCDDAACAPFALRRTAPVVTAPAVGVWDRATCPAGFEAFAGCGGSWWAPGLFGCRAPDGRVAVFGASGMLWPDARADGYCDAPLNCAAEGFDDGDC